MPERMHSLSDWCTGRLFPPSAAAGCGERARTPCFPAVAAARVRRTVGDLARRRNPVWFANENPRAFAAAETNKCERLKGVFARQLV
jgi:hypothetical protein